jgi:hypothetical protein
MNNKLKQADAATAQTTATKVMTKSKIKEDKMLAIRATIEETVRPLAEIADEFVNSVNKITHDEAGFTTPIVSSDFLIKNNVDQLCDMVIYSRISADDKLYILRLLEGLIYYVSSAGCIEGYSMCKNLWENMIRCDADYRIVKRNESKNMNKE